MMTSQKIVFQKDSKKPKMENFLSLASNEDVPLASFIKIMKMYIKFIKKKRAQYLKKN